MTVRWKARRAAGWAGAMAVLAASTLVASRIGAHDGSADAVPTTTLTVTSLVSPRLNPLTPLDPTRVPPDEAAAITRLDLVASKLAPADGHGHAHGPTSTVPLSAADTEALDGQLAQAAEAALAVATPEAAEAAGYRTAAVTGAGVGTHYVKWTFIDQPFDPAKPAMLLFDLRPGQTQQVVGLSYWVRSDTEPEGFVGPNDVWHQHTGLCVVNGWIDRENSQPPPACPGAWFGGADLWMLHVWAVPGWENREGVFANINQKLCPPDAGTPDIARCSFFEGDGA